MNIVDKGKQILLKIHKLNQDSWLLVSVFLSTSSVWFSFILTYWGESLSLIKVSDEGKRSFTIIGIILTIVVVAFSFLLVAAQKYYEYSELNNDKDKIELQIIKDIQSSTNEICNAKYTTLINLIYNIKNGSNEIIPSIISNPKEQLKQIMINLCKSLCSSLSYKDYKITNDEMYVCLHYNFPLESDEWYLAESYYPERNVTTKQLMEQPSTLKKILNFQEDFIFNNSKEDARKANEYIPDEEDQFDENNNIKGSIACYKMPVIFKNETYINAVVSFVTYSKKFVDTQDKKKINNVKYNIKKCILIPFKKRFYIELCLLYLEKLHELTNK